MSESPSIGEMDALSVDEQAARWFARRRSDQMNAIEAANLQRWLDQSPAHRSAYRTVEATWAALEAVRNQPQIKSLRASVRRTTHRTRLRGLGGLSGLAAAACILGFFLQPHGVNPPEAKVYREAQARTPSPERLGALPTTVLSTAVGERRSFTLADRSVVTLDTDTSIRVGGSKAYRLVVLTRGRAYFQVAKNRVRPFIVLAGDKRVEAVGTAFDVSLSDGTVAVTLKEGVVRVEAGLAAPKKVAAQKALVEAADLTPGNRLLASRGEAWSLTKVDSNAELSWLTGQFVFDNRPLGDVVAQMNRYSRKKLVLGDDSLKNRLVSGVFAAGQPDQLADALESYGLVRVKLRSETSIVLGQL